MIRHYLVDTIQYLGDIFSNWLFKTIISFVFMCLWFMFWHITISIYALLILYAIDFILWFGIAFHENKISLAKLKKGILKFILYGIAIITWNLVDVTLAWHTINIWLKYFIVIYLAITEAISVFKHLAYCNVKLPTRLIKALEQYKWKLDDCDDLIPKL